MTKLTTLTAALAAITLMGAAGAAQAEGQEDIMVVRISDLNTSSPTGAQTALRRIKQAANAFCGEPSRDVARQYAQRSCVKRLTNQAVSQLDAPMVTALHQPSTPAQGFELAQSGTTTR